MQIITRMATNHQKKCTRSQIILTFQSTILWLDIKTKLLSLYIIYVVTNQMGVNTSYTTSYEKPYSSVAKQIFLASGTNSSHVIGPRDNSITPHSSAIMHSRNGKLLAQYHGHIQKVKFVEAVLLLLVLVSRRRSYMYVHCACVSACCRGFVPDVSCMQRQDHGIHRLMTL